MRSRVLASLAALVALAVIGAGGYVILRLAGPASGPVTLTVGAERLRFASAYLRQNAGGSAELVVFFPTSRRRPILATSPTKPTSPIASRGLSSLLSRRPIRRSIRRNEPGASISDS